MSFDPEAVRAFEQAGWERAAATYEASFATATRCFVDALLDAAGIAAGGRSPPARVLDVATGSGVVAHAASQRGTIVHGLDFSPAMLAVASARHAGIIFDQGDAEALPYADGMFDAVVSNFGVHHVPRPVLALREAFRVLRPGGRIAFSIWAAPARNIAWKLLFDAVTRHGNPAASNAPAPGGGFSMAADCEAVLCTAGFSAVSIAEQQAVWRHAGGAALVAALRGGTARMAAMIAAQDTAAMPAIIAAIDAAATPYRDGAGIAVPIAALIASAVKE